jgi:hypothetical protein
VSRESSGSEDGVEEWKIGFKEDYQILGISNLLNIPLDYEIVNDTMYFLLEYPEPDKMIEGFQKHEIRVLPNMKALLRNAENFRRVSILLCPTHLLQSDVRSLTRQCFGQPHLF